MASKTIPIPLVIWDGALQFDLERLDEITDADLRTWLGNCAPEDLLSGELRITVPARVRWVGDEVPELMIAEEEADDGE